MYKKIIEQALQETIDEMKIPVGDYNFRVVVLDYIATAINEVLEPVKVQLPRFSDSEPSDAYELTVVKQ